MILDRLEHADLYRSLGPRVGAALDYLRTTDFSQVTEGRHELDGDRLVAILQRYRTRPPAKARWEAHQQYLDVQYLVEGVERIGWAALGLWPVAEPHDAAKDVAFYEAQGDLFELRAGTFAIFGPQDIHAPGLVGGEPPLAREVLKVVMKCRIDQAGQYP